LTNCVFSYTRSVTDPPSFKQAKLPESTGLLQFRFFELRGSTLYYFSLIKHESGKLLKGVQKGHIVIWNEKADKQYSPERLQARRNFKLVATDENGAASKREYVFSCENDRLVDKWVDHLSKRTFTFEECRNRYAAAGQGHLFHLVQRKKDRTLLAAQLTTWNPSRLSRYLARAQSKSYEAYVGDVTQCRWKANSKLLQNLFSKISSGQGNIPDLCGPDTPSHNLPEPFKDAVRLDQLDPLVFDALREKGLATIAQGAVAVVLQADGVSHCENDAQVKGSINIGLPSQTCLFGLVASRIKRLQELAAEKRGFSTRPVRLYVMVSEQNFAEVLEFWDAHDFFSLDSENVLFF
jgi:hypothetical protein